MSDSDETQTVTNFTSSKPASWYAELYRKDKLNGGHIIRLGSGNDEAAAEAISSWKDGLQLGGGITAENAPYWLNLGASAVIVTSYIFKDGNIYENRLQRLAETVGKENLVLDLSCRRHKGKYWIVTDRWQRFTSVEINNETLNYFARYCHEFLVHAVDVEGKCDGIEVPLVEILGRWGKIPITYAGGIRSRADIDLIKIKGNDHLDFTVGSALDIFGGKNLKYEDLVKLN